MSDVVVLPEYRSFLAHAARGLVASGAQVLISGEAPPINRAPWTEGWDSIILVDQPGATALYAFTSVNARSVDDVHRRIDQLANGVASSGLIRGPGLKVISVIVFPNGMSGIRPQTITRMAPSTYFSGIRPSTWAVDLVSQKVHTSGLGRGDGVQVIDDAVRGVAGGEILDHDGVLALEREHTARMDAFYRLMRGQQPLVTYALVAINVLIFLLLYANGGPTNETTLRDFGALSPRLIEHGEWWRLFSSMFLHAGVPHILFNMTSLFAVGTLAERMYGNTRYLAIYLGSGLIGSLVSFGYAVIANNIDILGVGASGAIFGVAGALLTVRFQSSDVIPQGLRTRVSTSLLPLVGISLLFSFLTPYVDNSAHIGGLLGGIGLSFLFPIVKRAPTVGQRT